MNISRRLTNQAAFDGAMLSLLNQGHSCVSASGHARYRGPRGKSAIGALIPDDMYLPSMEGKKIHHWLAARGSEYDALRERLGGVTPALLNELEDLHDRIGACMPSLYRQLAVAGAQRIAQNFKLSMRLVQQCAAYQYLRGPRLPWAPRIPAIPATPRTLDLAPATGPMASPAAVSDPTTTPPPAPGLSAAPTPASVLTAAATPAPNPTAAPTPVSGLAAAAPPAPNLTAAPTPAPGPTAIPTPAPALAATPAQQPLPLTQPAPTTSQEDDLDLIARGLAKAIAAARRVDQPG